MQINPSSILLLNVWREVCRHLEIKTSTTTLTRMLADHFPLDPLIVRRFHIPHSTLETVSWGRSALRLHRRTQYNDLTDSIPTITRLGRF